MNIRALARNIRRKIAPRRGVPAVGSVDEVRAVYDEVFEKDEHFDILDVSNSSKLSYVMDFAKSVAGTVLDAGSGRGSVLRFMLDNGIDAFGIELSTAACNKYLQGLPHVNADIITWAERGYTYPGLISTDVMEHIPPDQIDAVLEALAKLAPRAFLGIANHSSIHEGHELHVIQQGHKWWMQRVGQYFPHVELIRPKPGDAVLEEHLRKDRFFFLLASR